MKFEEIQELKNEKQMIKNNINYSKVMAAKLYPQGFKFTLKCIALTILFEINIKYTNNLSEVLISYNNKKGKRNDQDYIMEKLKQIVKNYNELTIERTLSFPKICFKLINYFKTIYKNQNLKINILNNLRVSALENYFENIFKKLQIIDFKEKLYISFCDSYLEENLFTQYFFNKKIFTATLQHGQYRYIKKDYETTDVEAYLNFVSNYLFSWGEITEKEFIKAKIEESRILNVGALKQFTDRNIIRNSFLNNKFGIILNGETHSESNIKMIKLANQISEKYSMTYYIRPHPMNKLNKYLKYVDKKFYISLITDNTKYGFQVDFSILHMTAVFVEMLSYNTPFFVFNDEWTEEIFKIDMITVRDISEFDVKYKRFNDNKEKFLDILNNQYYQYNCSKNNDELSENYLNAINNILRMNFK